MATTNPNARSILKSGAVTADTVSTVNDSVTQNNSKEALTNTSPRGTQAADRQTRQIIMATMLLAASQLTPGLSSPAHAHDDHDDYDYERPSYQGGLIDSYDRYNPRLYRRGYPGRVPNNYDYERRGPSILLRPRCLYTCDRVIVDED